MTDPAAPLFEPIHSAHEDFLRDESRKAGRADSISFPRTDAEVCAVFKACAARGLAVTVQGGRTGITAGAVPAGGHVLNLSRMNGIGDIRPDPSGGRALVTVQPGVLLSDLRDRIASAAPGWFFAPDPTEATATVGGMIACNASGARSLRYGPTRKHVERIRVVLADGNTLELARGRERASGRSFSLNGSGRKIEGVLPGYRMPAVKNAAGYFADDDMDLLDLFIGSEGTLGVVTEADLVLLPAPAFAWGVTAFLPDEDRAVRFVRRVRDEGGLPPAAIEFFDGRALDLLRRQKKLHAAFAELPDPPVGSACAVYVELHSDSEDALTSAVLRLSGVIAACGGDEDETWTAVDGREMKRLNEFRHAVPEAVNLLIDERRREVPELTKLGTDMAVPDAELERVMALYREGLEPSGLEYVMFGHIGDNHVHVNILPRSLEEYERGRELYLGWAREVIRMGGTVSAEHGVGKLKVALLKEMYGERGIEEMKAVKRAFDPDWRLNRGNLFDA